MSNLKGSSPVLIISLFFLFLHFGLSLDKSNLALKTHCQIFGEEHGY